MIVVSYILLDANNISHIGNIKWVDLIYKWEHHFISMRSFEKEFKNKTVRVRPKTDNIIMRLGSGAREP